MAKKSMINKQQKTPKFSTRAYTRCTICGRPHAVLRKIAEAAKVYLTMNEVCRYILRCCKAEADDQE